LASEYGWSKREILEEIYIDELMCLTDVIKSRKSSEYKMQLAIVSNPHTKKPRELWDALNETTRKPLDEKLDKQGMMDLKRLLVNSKQIVVK